jgi:uncharacterized protein
MNNVFAQPGPVDQYLRYLAEGQFKLQRSTRSGEYLYYPSAFGSHAASDELEWVDVSGHGTVYSVTTVRRPAKLGGDYNTSIVQLDEGPRMLTRVLGIEPDRVKIGMKVSAKIALPTWDAAATQPLVVFYPQAT